MAPLAIVGLVISAVSGIVTAVSKANALRAEAEARQIEGEQELLSSKRQLRQELGQAAVGVGASGLLGSSFANVFESQAIEDAEFLGRIKQWTDFDVATLRQQATLTMVTGLLGVGGGIASGAARAKGRQEQLGFAREEAERQRNIFASSRAPGTSGLTRARQPSTATFY